MPDHGGKRDRAGRKPKKPRVPLHTTVKPETVERLDRLRKPKQPRGEVIDEAVEKLDKSKEKP